MAAARTTLLFIIGVVFFVNYSKAQQCTKPQLDLTRSGVRRAGQDSTNIQSLCLPNYPARSLFVDCFGIGTFNRTWHLNGVRQSETGPALRVDNSGNYTCTLMNACGTIVFPVLFPTEGPILSISSQTQGATQIGTGSICLSSSSSGINPSSLSCDVSNANKSSLYGTYWSRNGNALASFVNMSTIQVSQPGTYVCLVENHCNTSNAQTIVQAHPAIKKGTGVNASAMIDVGTDSCLGRGNLMIFCNVVGGITVTRRWIKNGRDLSSTANKLTVTPTNDRDDNYTCTVQTSCSTDMATTMVIRRTEANISAMIMGRSGSIGTGCNRVRLQIFSLANVCPQIGENVTISCSATPGATYTIRGPRNTVVNRNLIIANFQAADSGIYTCTATSRCANATSALNITHIDRPPDILTRPPPGGNPPTPPPGQNISIPIGNDTCLLANQTANITCQATGLVLSYRWTRNGVFFSTMQNLVGVSFGTYVCTAIGLTANDSAVSRVLPVATVALTVNSAVGSRCMRLLRPPPNGTDFCAFRNDRITLQCTSSPSDVQTRIYPNGEVGQRLISSVQPSHEGSYMCNGTNACGSPSDMITMRVYDPARIDVNKALPVPQVGEVIAGAGRPTEPVCGREGQKISLHCCYTGIDQPTAQWYFVHPNGTQERVNTSDRSISVMVVGMNSILTIDPFMQRHVGKYRCGVTNIAGNMTGDVDLIHKPPEDKQWSKGRWSSCSLDCHRGFRNRTVTCVTVSSRIAMADSFCPTPKPPTFERCSRRGPCARWVAQPWSQCSASCGGGFRFRNITCMATYAANLPLPSSQCPPAASGPRTVERCNNQPCPCVEPNFCRSIRGSELCWNPRYLQMCCCTCGAPPSAGRK